MPTEIDPSTSDLFNNEEAARRRDEALRRALSTPPQPKPTLKPKDVKPAPEKTRRQANPKD